MDRWLSRSALLPWLVAAARLLVLSALAAVLFTGEPPTDLLAVILLAGALYAVIAIATALVGLRSGTRLSRGLRAGAVVADLAIVSFAIVVHQAEQPVLWPLYLLPVALALPGGSAATRTVAGLAVLAAVVSLTPTEASVIAVAWPGAVLAVLGLLLSRFAAPDDTAAAREEEWHAAATIGRLLAHDLDQTATAAGVADAARSLSATRAAYVWSWDVDTAHVELRARSGHHPPPELARLDAGVLAELRKHPRTGVLIAEQDGETLLTFPLLAGDAPIAIVAVGPARAAAYSPPVRDRLASFAAWAGEVLARTAEHERARAAHARELALRTAAGDLAAGATQRDALEAIAAAAGSQLRARAALIARASGELLVGDAEWATAYGADGGGTVRRLDTGVLLAVDRLDAALTSDERRWLDELARIANPALRRCAARDQLAEQLALMTETLEQLPAPALIYTPDRRVLRMNAAFRSLRARLPELEPPGDSGEVTLGDPPQTFVVDRAELAGKHALVLLRDITRERQALRAKEELIAMMGHELRTPLTSVQGYSRMMVRHLDVVRDQVERLDRIIESFVDVASSNDVPPARLREPLDPAELAHEAADRFRGGHEERELALVIGPALPVLGDRSALGQVFDNLLDNAAKYSPPDRPIELIVESRGDDTLFAVRDHGDGIAAEDLERIFERSYRVGSDRSVRGQGFGLSIVRDVLAAHGGAVWAESGGRGQGSTFWFQLPVARDDEFADAVNEPRVPPDSDH